LDCFFYVEEHLICTSYESYPPFIESVVWN